MHSMKYTFRITSLLGLFLFFSETPYAAQEAAFIGTKLNRHCHWDSNLHHGVFSNVVDKFSGKRITLAINWWDM